MKLPIFKAVGATFAYVIANLLTVIQILWLPMAVYFGLNFWTGPMLTEMQLDLADIDGAEDPEFIFQVIGNAMTVLGIVVLGFLVLYLMMYAGIYRHLLRGERPSLPFYFRFGADELRLIGAAIVLSLLMLALYIGLIVAAVAAAGAGAVVGETFGGILAALIGFVGICLFFVAWHTAQPGVSGSCG